MQYPKLGLHARRTPFRVGFKTMADQHMRTIGRGMDGTTKLTGPVLMECIILMAVLKHEQQVGENLTTKGLQNNNRYKTYSDAVAILVRSAMYLCNLFYMSDIVPPAGPCVWYALPGQQLVARQPKAVATMDLMGAQDGANYWRGLYVLMEVVNAYLWSSVSWIRHECDICCKTILDGGVSQKVQAAVIDGITATRSGLATLIVHTLLFSMLRISQRSTRPSCIFRRRILFHDCNTLSSSHMK